MDSHTPECEVSVVMPCLNEAETVAVCVRKAVGFFEREKISGEVIVADNGSTDGSPELATKEGARVVHVPEKGYGSALLGGIRESRGKYIIMGDSDDSYDFTKLMPFIEKLREGYDLVMGNRFKGGIAPGAMPPLHKYFGNPLLTKIAQIMFKSPCQDIQCGLRGFSKEAFKRMDTRSGGMEFASEVVVKAAILKMRITEVPTTLSPDGRNRPPHIRSWRDGWRNLRFNLLFSPRWLFLIPGLVLLALGMIFGAILTWKTLSIGSVAFDTSTLLVCSMSVILGFQLVFSSLLAKAFAIREKLLPPDERVDRFLRIANLETGIIVGLLLCVAGAGLLGFAVWSWEQHNFGPMNYAEVQRLTIPGVTFIILGFQVVFASFFMGILRLNLK